jgi:hypothetical protein
MRASTNRSRFTNAPSPSGEGVHISWHSAFVEALQMELYAYRDALEYHAEFPLISEPLEDCFQPWRVVARQIR